MLTHKSFHQIQLWLLLRTGRRARPLPPPPLPRVPAATGCSEALPGRRHASTLGQHLVGRPHCTWRAAVGEAGWRRAPELVNCAVLLSVSCANLLSVATKQTGARSAARWTTLPHQLAAGRSAGTLRTCQANLTTQEMMWRAAQAGRLTTLAQQVWLCLLRCLQGVTALTFVSQQPCDTNLPHAGSATPLQHCCRRRRPAAQRGPLEPRGHRGARCARGGGQVPRRAGRQGEQDVAGAAAGPRCSLQLSPAALEPQGAPCCVPKRQKLLETYFAFLRWLMAGPSLDGKMRWFFLLAAI